MVLLLVALDRKSLVSKRAVLQKSIALILFLVATVSQASPWLGTGDLQARHHLEALSERGCFNGLTLSWPVNWSAVAYGLDSASKACRATPDALWLRARLKGAEKRHRTATVSLGGATQEPLYRHFGDQPAGKADEALALEFTGHGYAARLEARYVDDQRDHSYWRPDGSYVAGRFGNWQLGAGAIQRWWGPGWQSSLALSNNARPVPGIWLDRQTPYAPETSWLHWIGPWDLRLFAGQLEHDRFIPDTRLVGMRLTFRPASFLQLGLTRMFQWAGQGRPDSLKSFGDALIGRDNSYNTSISAPGNPSNQIAGFDFRASFPVFGVPSGLYGQAMGEDEAGYLPTKFSVLGGVDALTDIGSGSQRFFVEATNTVSDGYKGTPYPHVAYEHSVYRSGYRYDGRNLATTYEGDARVVSLGVQQYFLNGVVVTATVSKAALNIYGGERATIVPGGAQILQATHRQDVYIAALRLEHGFLGGRLTWALQATNKAVITDAGKLDRVTAMAQWRRTFDW